jgi:bacteriocin biosynthesis cyclodehydratase domain-containing protein
VRPLLRPGLQILRRDARTVQLGLDWPGVCTLAETPALRSVLTAIDGFRDLRGVVMAAVESGTELDDAQSALDLLIDCGAVVDQAKCWRRDADESSWASWWLLAGPEGSAADILRERQRRHVRVHGSGQIAAAVGPLLTTACVPWSHDSTAPDLVVLAHDGEPSRELADELMRDGVPHVWACVRDVVGVVGPFVVPGVTGCLRCADQARAEVDPAWLTLLEAAAARRPVVPACDPLLAALVGSWVAHEVTAWASGLRAQTLDAIIEVPFGFGTVASSRVQLHPACGCGWPISHDTMGT